MKYMENAIIYLFSSFKIQKRKRLKLNNSNENVIMIVTRVSTRTCMALYWYYIMALLK